MMDASSFLSSPSLRIKFPDFIHSQEYDPHTTRQEPDNIWDFFSHTPEATHQFTWLFVGRGLPASYRQMKGYGSHTFSLVNADGELHWVKFHFKSEQGGACLTSEEAGALGAEEPAYLNSDLYAAIERGEHPPWSVEVQIMAAAEAAGYRHNPFDLTKVWPHADYPRIKVGRLVLERTPDNEFAEVEQAAFDPGHFVPGIGPSPDKMLQARLLACGDAHRCRLGINRTRLPVNAAKGAPRCPYKPGRDGAMRLLAAISGSLAQVSREDVVARSLENVSNADADYGRRLGEAVARLREG